VIGLISLLAAAFYYHPAVSSGIAGVLIPFMLFYGRKQPAR
jgi:hypothetical protein